MNTTQEQRVRFCPGCIWVDMELMGLRSVKTSQKKKKEEEEETV